MIERLRIERLGRRGDGLAQAIDGARHIPFALPGEFVEILGSELLAVLAPSPARVAPFCPVFGRCGGCVAQHMERQFQADWKRAAVTGALGAAHLPNEVGALVDAHGEGRRRLTLHARFGPSGPAVGFMARQSHDLVPIETCPIAEPALARAPAVARGLAKALSQRGKPLDIQITATETGLDIDIRGHGTPVASERRALITLSEALDLARLSLHGDVLIERRPPLLTIGRASVAPPPGGFLQATAAGEAALAQRVVEACTQSRRVADLFAGIGPFALRLAEKQPVLAIESDGAALAALSRAARATPGLKRIDTETRDLFRRPLLPGELAAFDAVVLDPPRAGAEAQARQLAGSAVPLVVSVSCDPGTFARDAAILVAGGYAPGEVTPIDQFRHSPHVELVGTFRKAARKVARPRSLK